ncbi:Protein YSY6 [Cytospora mali]|uniref:Stress-associated endoplasmic reticulum protein n=1 Tax=Cytospora mali TaxID=578113 RepID=A0A194UYK0_CYTMA|nr:Protein YSY6 [Valsa mali var. pyri (nom. inval.)]
MQAAPKYFGTRSPAQTPQQRRANLKFAKQNEAKMGKSEEDVKKMIKKETAKAPISPLWLGLLGFVVFGGIIFEVLSRIFFGGR